MAACIKYTHPKPVGGCQLALKISQRKSQVYRTPDGMTATTLNEVKNVGNQSFTKQLRDYLDYAQDKGLRFDLYVRPNTTLSGPLEQARASGFINVIKIEM